MSGQTTVCDRLNEIVRNNDELDNIPAEAGTNLLRSSDFVFDINGDVYTEERIRLGFTFMTDLKMTFSKMRDFFA